MKKLFTLLIALVLFSPLQAQSFFAEDGEAVFISKVPLHTFEGSSQNLVGLINLDENILDFYLDLETLDTGNGKRDRDMKLTLETEEFPFAEFYGTLVSPVDLNNSEPQPALAKGTFKIHGEQQEVEIEGTLQPTSEGLLLKANWILNLNDYDIEPPSLLIIKVDENQEINIEILLKPYSEDQ
ncbi:MAG: YceI family protein [Balneolaceae bacterium]|nr:YceI family protein [Balneolaceae bacterium]